MSTTTAPTESMAGALGTAAPARRPTALSASLTFARRSVLKLQHVPEQLLDAIAVPIVFTVLFTYLFGGSVAGSTRAYLQFLLPGTLVMTVLLLTMYTGIGLNTDITTGAFDRFRTLPIWPPAPIVGALLGDVARYLLSSALVLGLGWVMGFRAEGGASGVAAALALTLLFAFGLSWIWTTLGLVLRSPRAVMNLGMSVLFPLTLASNAFVDPNTTPGWLEAIIRANPVTHLITAVRALMHHEPAAGEIGWVLIATAVLIVIFAPLTARLYRTKG